MSELPRWQWGSAYFYPISAEREIPRWKRELRVGVENLVGTGLAEFNTFGFGEFRLKMEAYIPDVLYYYALINHLGDVGTLSDGTVTWDDVILLSEDLKPVKLGWEGSIEFGRSDTA